MYNRSVLCGRLAKTPELLISKNNIEYTRIVIAVNNYRSRENKTVTFIEAIAWRNNAINICKYLQKGSMVLVEGSLKTNRDNHLFLSLDNIQFLDSKKSEEKKISESDTKIVVETVQPENTKKENNDYSSSKQVEAETTVETIVEEPTIDWDAE